MYTKTDFGFIEKCSIGLFRFTDEDNIYSWYCQTSVTEKIYNNFFALSSFERQSKAPDFYSSQLKRVKYATFWRQTSNTQFQGNILLNCQIDFWHSYHWLITFSTHTLTHTLAHTSTHANTHPNAHKNILLLALFTNLHIHGHKHLKNTNTICI